jgi:hypothetical protein
VGADVEVGLEAEVGKAVLVVFAVMIGLSAGTVVVVLVAVASLGSGVTGVVNVLL